MEIIEEVLVKKLTIEYRLKDEMDNPIDYLNSNYGEGNYTIKRWGPKQDAIGRVSTTISKMDVEVYITE